MTVRMARAVLKGEAPMKKAKVVGCILGAALLSGCATVHKIADTLEASAGIIDGAADDMGAIWDNTGGAVLPTPAKDAPK